MANIMRLHPLEAALYGQSEHRQLFNDLQIIANSLDRMIAEAQQIRQAIADLQRTTGGTK